MAARHPELREVVEFEDMLRMAARDEMVVRMVPLPRAQKGRVILIGGTPYVRINDRLSRWEQTVAGMHELCHVWRDGLHSATYYSDELTGGARCEFADIFAWYVTSGARFFVDRRSLQRELLFIDTNADF